MNVRELVPPPDLPAPDARVPGVAVRLVLAIVGILLSLVVYGSSGLARRRDHSFSLLAAWAPEYLLDWVLIVFLALGELSRPAALSWQLLVLLAGVHLLHAVGDIGPLDCRGEAGFSREACSGDRYFRFLGSRSRFAAGRRDTAVAGTECSRATGR